MNFNSIWSVLEEGSEILFNDYAYPAAGEVAQEFSLPPNFFTWVNAIWLFDANPFTLAQYMRYFPYGLTQVNDARLASTVQRGYLTSNDQGAYRATESGRTVAARLMQAGDKAMAALTPMPKESLRTLGNFLARISDAAGSTPEPPAHVLIKAKRDLYQRMNTFALLEGFVAHRLLLEGYRDDCYIATWKAHGMEGHTWEVLDQLSQTDALTFDELHEKTSGRGVMREVHAADVQELARIVAPLYAAEDATYTLPPTPSPVEGDYERVAPGRDLRAELNNLLAEQARINAGRKTYESDWNTALKIRNDKRDAQIPAATEQALAQVLAALRAAGQPPANTVQSRAQQLLAARGNVVGAGTRRPPAPKAAKTWRLDVNGNVTRN